MPLIEQILNGTAGISQAPTAGQQQAVQGLTTAAKGLPSYGAAAGGVTSGLLGGDPTGLLGSSLSAYQNNINPIASASLDPTQTPGIQNVLATIRNDISKSVNDQFAGAGRDLSGMNQQTLARGISQGEAVPLLNQYNQNVSNVMGANQGLLGAGYQTAGGITGNQQAGLTAAGQQPSIALAPALAQLQAAQTKYNLPISNIAGIQGLTLPIAGQFGESSGYGSSSGSGASNTTLDPSTLSQIMQWMNIGKTGAGILGGFA